MKKITKAIAQPPPRPKPDTHKRTVRRTTVDGSGFDRAMVSFRGDVHVINELKKLAIQKGMPYQALLRRILKEYVDAKSSPILTTER